MNCDGDVSECRLRPAAPIGGAGPTTRRALYASAKAFRTHEWVELLGKIGERHDRELEEAVVRFKLQKSKSATQPYYFEIQASGNYETLATSETYAAKSDAQHAIDLIKSEAGSATVVDDT